MNKIVKNSVVFEMFTGFQMIKSVSALYGGPRLTAMFTKA
jgi:hypothetical protein